MTDLRKAIGKLTSPKSSTRYEACEELRLAEESSEEAVNALEAAAKDPDPLVAEAAANALNADVHLEMLDRLGRESDRVRARREAEELRRRRADSLKEMILVTSPTVEGRSVSEYLGIVSSEVVLGTGIFAEMERGLSDLLDVRSDQFQTKLRRAKEESLLELKIQAADLGANAVIAIDLDFSVVGLNMLMVVANGTAVRLS